MKSPATGKDMVINKEWKKLPFRKEEYDVLFHTWRCVDSGQEFEDDSFANLNYNQVVNQYREKHNIPFPEDIKAIRKQYKLPAIKMSKVLGLGDNTYRQYEAGEIPTEANGRLIQMSADPKKFLEMLHLSDIDDERSKNKAIANAEKLIKQEDSRMDAIQDYIFGRKVRTRYTGYSLPDFDKFTEMILFFSTGNGVWKTKLNKLLFYADFAFYKLHGRSISGATYCAIDMGPVPDNFSTIYEKLVKEGVLNVSFTAFPSGGVGEKYTLNKNFNDSSFTPEEIKTLHEVKEKLKYLSTREIIELSHQEEAWTENIYRKSQPIDYKYAYNLKLF